jgi:hypothetical protein
MVMCLSCGEFGQNTSNNPCTSCGGCKFGNDDSYCPCDVCSTKKAREEK